MSPPMTRVAALLLACLPLAVAGQSASAPDTPSSLLLRQIADEYSKQRPSADSQLTDVSESRARLEADTARSILKRLDPVQPAELTHDEWLTLGILKSRLDQVIKEQDVYWFLSPVTAQSNVFLRSHRVLERHPFHASGDLDGYRARLAEYPAFIGRIEAKLAGQAERGVVLPEEAIGPIVASLTQYVRDPAKSPFAVAASRLAKIDRDAAAEFQKDVARTIVSDLNPALTRLAEFLDGPLRAKAPKTVGLWQYPGGKDAYRLLIRAETTLDVSPEEAHKIGLREVAALERRLTDIRTRLDFKGSKEDFHRFLKTDPRFFPKTPEEIGNKLTSAIDRIRPALDRFFTTFPKAPYTIKRLNPALEGSMTYGYYTVPSPLDPSGYYFFNGSNLDQRSLLNAAALAYHEIMPGHHFHMAGQRERLERPAFRRNLGHSGFQEGWAEYASSGLAMEAGMYSDPYDLYGRLMYDTFFSVRLVVDTGLNFYGWPRAKAIAYMKEHTLESDTQIDSETLRYAVGSPAQALSYKLGSLKMFELRRKAERALGKRFDIKKFHEALVGSGSMPLTLLEEHIDWFIAQEKSGPALAEPGRGVPR